MNTAEPTRRDAHPLLKGYGAFTDEQVAAIEAMSIEVGAAVGKASSPQRIDELREEFVHHPALRSVRLPRHRLVALIGRMIDTRLSGAPAAAVKPDRHVTQKLDAILDRIEAIGQRVSALETAHVAAMDAKSDAKTEAKTEAKAEPN